MVEAWLPQFVHQRHIADAAHLLQDLLDGLAFHLQRLQVGAENLDGQCALQTRFGLVDRIFRRLGVIEIDAGK